MKKRQLREREAELRVKVRPDDRSPQVKVAEVEQKQGKLIVSMEEVEGGYDDTVLFSKTNVNIRFGQKICVLGRNGSGKTTLLRLVMGEIPPLSGVIRLGVNLKTSVFTQHSSIDLENTPFELMATIGVTTDKARQLLSRLLFTRGEMEMMAGRLSGGQQQRLRLALLFYAQPDFVILDEPTNNLDPTNWQLLCELVNEFEGTVLCVTHDRSFIEALNEPQVLVIAKKTLTRVWGSIDDAISLL
jgi:ATPase subunit of ABC transporter with duplicated ATPase domains